MVATTDQKARMFDLITGVSELTRDGNRDFEEVLTILQIIKNEKNGPKRLLENLVVATAIPADNEVFELTLDGDAPENDPIEMVKRDGYSEPEKWQFTGRKITGTQTCRFKLVRVGDCHNFDEVRQRLVLYGVVPNGQWREAFKDKYPRPDGRGPIGFCGLSWVRPIGDRVFRVFPSLIDKGGAWLSCFNSPDGVGLDLHDARWRWLVVVS